jgi:hypothetical protein
LHGLDETQLLLEKDAEEFVDPIRFVETAQDQLLRIDEAGGVLPAAGLISPDEPAQNSLISEAVIGPVHGRRVEARHGHEFLDQADILVLLDQGLGDPGRHPVPGCFVGQPPPRRPDRMVIHPIIRLVADNLDFVAPFRAGDFGQVCVSGPELPDVLKGLDGGVESKHLEGLEVADPPKIGLQVVGLPLVDRGRESVGLLLPQGAEHPFLGGHAQDYRKAKGAGSICPARRVEFQDRRGINIAC